MTIENQDQVPYNPYTDILEDDETVKRMARYFRQSSSDDLLNYIKRYGVHRHAKQQEP
jgi:hypothetical protein